MKGHDDLIIRLLYLQPEHKIRTTDARGFEEISELTRVIFGSQARHKRVEGRKGLQRCRDTCTHNSVDMFTVQQEYNTRLAGGVVAIEPTATGATWAT